MLASASQTRATSTVHMKPIPIKRVFFGFGDSRNPLLQMGLMDGAVAERLDSRVGNLTARVDACNSPPLLAPAFFTAPFRRHRHRILFPTTRPPHVRWVTCPYVTLFPVLHETTLGGNSNLLLAFLLSHEDLSSQQLRFTCNISLPFREQCLGDSPWHWRRGKSVVCKPRMCIAGGCECKCTLCLM